MPSKRRVVGLFSLAVRAYPNTLMRYAGRLALSMPTLSRSVRFSPPWRCRVAAPSRSDLPTSRPTAADLAAVLRSAVAEPADEEEAIALDAAPPSR